MKHRTSTGSSRVTCTLCRHQAPRATGLSTWDELQAEAEGLAEGAGFVLVPLAQGCAWLCPGCAGALRRVLVPAANGAA